MKLIVYVVFVPFLVLLGFWTATRYGMIFGYPFWMIASIIIAFPVAGILAAPFGTFFLPGDRYSRPLPMYSIPESLRKQDRIPEAMAKYREITEKYPKEVKPWVQMVRLAHLELKDRNLADELLEEGLKALKKEASREELTRMHQAITSMRQEAPTADDRTSVHYRSEFTDS